MIAALFALLLQLLASWMDQPAPDVQTPPAPPAVVVPAPAPVASQPYRDAPRTHDAPSGRPGPTPETVPTCLAGEEWDGLHCVALQLPEETGDRG
jgi:hypothetical protein